MKVLVTGGAGFIGSHVIDACRAHGWEVLCIDSLDPGVHHGAPSYLRSDVDYCFADLRHWTPDARFKDVNAIFHLAALGGVSRASHDRANVLTANAAGTARLVEWATSLTELRNFILAGSFSVYGSNYRYRCSTCGLESGADRSDEKLKAGEYEVYCTTCGTPSQILPIGEDTPPQPLEAYACSKYMQELCLRGTGLPYTIFRFSSAYGTRLRLDDGEATIIAKLASWIRSGQQPTLYEDGQQIRDWVHVKDICDAAVAILKGAKAESVINICSEVPTTLIEACALIAKTAKVQVSPRVVGGFRPGDMRHCLGDASRLRKLIGRDPISFKAGVADLVCDSTSDSDKVQLCAGF